MAIHAISFKNNNAAKQKKVNEGEIDRYTYPMTYDQYKYSHNITQAVGSVFFGGICACIMKLAKFGTKSSYIGGAIIAAGTLLLNLSKQFTGELEVKYLEKKRKFENPELTYKGKGI